MPLKLQKCGPFIRQHMDSLSNEEAKDPEHVARAMGEAVEEYIEVLLKQLTLTIPPTPGLGTSTSPGSPTAPGVPATFAGVNIFK